MSLAELLPLVEALSQLDKAQLLTFLSKQQPEVQCYTSIADCYGICADDPIILDNGGILASLDDDMVGVFD